MVRMLKFQSDESAHQEAEEKDDGKGHEIS